MKKSMRFLNWLKRIYMYWKHAQAAFRIGDVHLWDRRVDVESAELWSVLNAQSVERRSSRGLDALEVVRVVSEVVVREVEPHRRALPTSFHSSRARCSSLLPDAVRSCPSHLLHLHDERYARGSDWGDWHWATFSSIGWFFVPMSYALNAL